MLEQIKIYAFLGGIIALALLFIWIPIKLHFPSGTWRYRVTVEVVTPEGIMTGSAVREVRAFTDFRIGDHGGGGAGSTGEAVVVDLQERGLLFLLTSIDEYEIVFRAFPLPQGIRGGLTREGIAYYSNLKNARTSVLSDKSRFQIVRFRTPTDPLTVELVVGQQFDPATQQFATVDRMQELFGEGVVIKDIIVEMTDDPVTTVIDSYLPWLQEVGGGYLDGRFSGGGPDLSNILHGGNFMSGKRR